MQGVLARLRKNPGPLSSWKEATNLLGRRQTKLPECTSNSDPNNTAEFQNQYFVKKISDLLNKIPANSFKCDTCDKNFSENSE